MNSAYFDRGHLPRFPEIAKGNQALADAFFGYYGQVFADGALSVREKACVALAVAHTVQCPYCIDAYTQGSLEAGADVEQMTEAVHVSGEVRSHSVMDYGLMMLAQATAVDMRGASATMSSAYFSREHATQAHALVEQAPELGRAFEAWSERCFAEGALSTREKHLIALACAHAIQCPYAIERHTRALHGLGSPLSELTEAVHVANAIRGGAALVHGVQMLDQTAASSQGAEP